MSSGWQDTLDEIIDDHRFEMAGETTWRSIEAAFRARCPGPYVMRFACKNGVHVDLVFDDPTEQVFWLLRYS